MPVRMRATVKPTGDRVGEMQAASDLRRDLWARVPVAVDLEHPLHGIHRDEAGRAYIEFITEFPAEIRRVIEQLCYAGRVELDSSPGLPGEECVNCGNVAGPERPAVCPNCGFRDISPCSVCGEEVPRESYVQLAGDLFRCPQCRHQVRLRFNRPMFLPDGSFNQPLVVVEEATASHEVR